MRYSPGVNETALAFMRFFFFFFIDLRDRVRRHFVAVCIEILHLAIVRPFVRDVKSGRDRAAIRILTAVFEQLAVQGFVKVVYGVVESEQNDLRRLLDRNTTCASQLHYVARDTITEAVSFLSEIKK